MELRCNFKAAGKPKTYGQEGKTLTNFYVDIGIGTDYPSMAEFTFFGDKLNLDGIKQGDDITVSFSISGRKAEWKDKATGKQKSGFFQTLVAWKVESHTANVTESNNTEIPKLDEEDDLPF